MRRVVIRFALLAVACLATAAPAAAAGEAPGAAACAHYENRARFASREREVAFTAVLADACAGARATLADGAAPARRRAAATAFLLRLDEARAAITAMDAARFAARRAAGLRDGGVGAAVRDFRRAYGLVSEAGEFLILREAGVFARLGDWVAAGADFALIAALPQRGAARP